MTLSALSTPDDEETLLAHVRGGDENQASRAFTEIVTRYQWLVEQTAWSVVHDTDIVNDVVQSLWTAWWEKRHTLIVREGLPEYLAGTARNRAINWHRDEHCHHDAVFKAPRQDPVQNEAIYTFAVEDHEHDVDIAVSELPERRGQVYRMVMYDGYTHEQVAELLGMALQTVYNQMTQANQYIRRRLAQLSMENPNDD